MLLNINLMDVFLVTSTSLSIRMQVSILTFSNQITSADLEQPIGNACVHVYKCVYVCAHAHTSALIVLQGHRHVKNNIYC